MKEKNDPDRGAVTISNRDMRVQQTLEKLRDEYSKLHEQKIATDRDRKNLEEQLKELRSKAEREYGTSDVEQLRTLLEQRRQENERMVEEYRRHVEGIKEQLEQIEKGDGRS
jgi:chromosome segregation ATPase